jgi:monovalent cation:H+ antiporter-2, CPA2 family
MLHSTSLIATLVAAFGLALLFGVLANRLRLSPLVGYLVAGVLIGPFTPGYVADQGLAAQLAEIGVILLMFGVGLRFSLSDLLAVRATAVPGALGQMTLVTGLGLGLAYVFGWTLGAGIVFGLALSVASTVVVLQGLQDRRLVQTDAGALLSAGSSSRTLRWCWSLSCYLHLKVSWAAHRPPRWPTRASPASLNPTICGARWE